MHTTSFLIGLIIGAGIISIIYWIINSNKKNTSNDDIKLLKNEFDVVSSSIKDIVGKQLTMEEIYRNISLKSDSIDKSVIAAKNLMTSGGSKSQGDWGERVLKTALENMGYKDGFGYESQKEYLDEQGNVMPGKSTLGGLAVGVPGTVAGLAAIHKKFGTLPWEDLVQPAIDLARKGYFVTKKQQRSFESKKEDFIAVNGNRGLV